MPEHPTVRIYTTPSCSWCKVAKKYFRERGIRYTEYDVSKDERKYGEMVHKSRQNGVPVITVGSRVVVGFDQKKIEKYLQSR